ncbi:glycosyltransferase family 2 protein [Mycobacterium sp. WMMD1722]|uniref:glycosyltransferase family 2 protein n=1 Tax=Mycobacterium sp. WMMD1722 TaxID=3404117 RepID=UPI003BF586F8
MTLLIVTPMYNEADNVAGLVASLGAQRFKDFDWVVVDDGSTDGTADRLAEVDTENLATVLSKANDGGLIAGSEFRSWRFGVERALPQKPYSHVMKLDADARLAPDYLERVVDLARGTVGIAGGVIVTRGMAEQKFHVPGAVKLYTIDAYRATESIPAAHGFDAIDEVAVSLAGLETQVDPGAHFELTRAVGASAGEVQGRYRNGRTCRWIGYSFPYFLVHFVRYFARRPYVVGAFALLWGYLSAGGGPFAPELKKAHARMQRAKLARALRNPLGFWREAYKI